MKLSALLTCVALCACASSEDEAISLAIIDRPAAAFQPGLPRSPAARSIHMATSEGLVGFDEEGRLVPALAERWIVTDDGLSTIFRLREGSWSDGTNLTGEQAAAALRQALARLRDTTLAKEAEGIEAIVARTGRVLEIQTSVANPDILRLLAQPELALLHNEKGSGPMQMMREGLVAYLTPTTKGRANRSVGSGPESGNRSVRLAPVSAGQAISRFRDGEVEAILDGRWADLSNARSLGLTRGTLQFDPVAGLFGLIMLNQNGFLAEAANREALAMAIDREAMADRLGIADWKPSNRIVTTGLEDDSGAVGERWSDLDLAERQAKARQRVMQWRAANGQPSLRLAVPVGPGAQEMFHQIQADLMAIGVRLQRVGPNDEADLRFLDEAARFARPTWFLDQLSCDVRPVSCSKIADILLGRARTAQDAGTRARLLAEAEAELTMANTFIPFGPPVRWTIIRRGLKGVVPNRWGIHPITAIGG